MNYKFLLFSVLFVVFSCKKEKPSLNPVVNLNSSPSVKIIQDEFEDTPIVVVGSSGKKFIVSFKRTLEDDTLLEFTASGEPLPIIMEDNEGNSWDIFGTAVKGARKGERLIPTKSMMGYWFIFNAMYPGVDIYGEEPLTVERPIIAANDGWSIPTTSVFPSLGFDAIPSIDNPAFESQKAITESEEYTYLKENGLVVGVVVGDQARAYPYSILNWNEIVNDVIGDLYFSVVYCPLTSTTQVWNRKINSEVTTFGVSGKLYNSNLLPYDRLTTSIWTQLEGNCVFGDLINDRVERLALVETSWATWKEMYPSSEVLKIPQEFSWDYNENPYSNYISNSELILFPVDHVDNRLSAKERVHGVIINRQVKTYRVKDF